MSSTHLNRDVFGVCVELGVVAEEVGGQLGAGHHEVAVEFVEAAQPASTRRAVVDGALAGRTLLADLPANTG